MRARVGLNRIQLDIEGHHSPKAEALALQDLRPTTSEQIKYSLVELYTSRKRNRPVKNRRRVLRWNGDQMRRGWLSAGFKIC